MPTTFRCVILAAVSDPGQVRDAAGDEKESIPYQIRRGREIIASHDGWTEIAEPLVIPGISRSLNWLHEAFQDIEAYRQLRDLVEARKVDLVVCRNYDRLARTSVLQQQVSAWLRENRVQIYAWEMPVQVHDPRTWQPRTDSARLVVEAIAGIQSETYVNSLWSYHRFGMEGRVKKGLHNEGTPPYGYKDVVAEDGYGKSKRKRIPDPETFPVVQRIFRMLLDGKTGVHVARWLNGDVDNLNGTRAPIPTQRGKLWTPTTVIQLARNPFYAGKVARYRFTLWNDGRRRRRSVKEMPGLLVDGVHEAAICWEDWQRVQQIVTDRAKFVPRLRRRDHVWSGLAVCGCGLDRGDTHSMRHCHDRNYNKDGTVNEYDYLICSRYSYTSGRECSRNTIRVADFVGGVLDWIRTVVADPSIVEAAAEHQSADPRDAIEVDLARVRESLARSQEEERQWDRAYRHKAIGLEKYADGLRDIQEERQKLELEEETLRQSLAMASASDLRIENRRRALDRLGDLLPLDPSDPEVVQRIHEVLDRVEIRAGSLRFVVR